MNRNCRSTAFMLLLTGLLLAGAAGISRAEGWSAPLQGGGEVRVDPRTNRAVIERGGVQTQLWDGVHRLKDGSTITVHSGTVVPNEAILNARSMPDHPRQAAIEGWVGTPISGASPCEKLVERVCGADRSCGENPACAPVRRLLDDERRERQASEQPGYMTYASGQCQEADRDRGFFRTCGEEERMPGTAGAPASPRKASPQPVGKPPPTACSMLVDKVCGADSACGGSEACSLSRQLMAMAKEQQAKSAFHSVPQDNPAETRCREALMDPRYFPRCR